MRGTVPAEEATEDAWDSGFNRRGKELDGVWSSRLVIVIGKNSSREEGGSSESGRGGWGQLPKW